MARPITPAEQAAIGQAQALHRAGRNAEAASLLRPIARRHTAHADLQMLAGMAARGAGQRGEAIAAFRNAAAARPDDPQIANILANTLAGAGAAAGATPGERRAALTLFDRLVERHPDFADASMRIDGARRAGVSCPNRVSISLTTSDGLELTRALSVRNSSQ